MTREQAFSMAIELLLGLNEKEYLTNTTHNIEECVELLKEMKGEMYSRKWTKEAVFDAIENFKIVNQRVPSIKEFDKIGGNLPSRTLIKNLFGTSVMDFMCLYYPNEPEFKLIESRTKTKEEWKELFIIEFKKIKPKTLADYELNRPKGYPMARTLWRYFGLKSWGEWLNFCGVTTSDKITANDFIVNRSSNIENDFRNLFNTTGQTDFSNTDDITYNGDKNNNNENDNSSNVQMGDYKKMNYLSKLIKCEICGKNFNYKLNNGSEQYLCSTRKKNVRDKCYSRTIRQDIILDVIEAHCKNNNKDYSPTKIKLLVKEILVDNERIKIIYKDGTMSYISGEKIIF